MIIKDETYIKAPVDRVWDLTIDVARWPELTTTMTSVDVVDEGPLQPGTRAQVVQPRQRPRIWTVREVTAPNRFVWDAKLGTITMTARHKLEASREGTRNTLELELTGLGSRLLGVLARRAFEKALATENDGFKKVAETVN